MTDGQYGYIVATINTGEARIPGHGPFLSEVCRILHSNYGTRRDNPHIRHSYASTTAIYTSVSNDFKTKTLQAALARVYPPREQ